MNKKTETVNFTIKGDWFTSHLRDLWTEYREMSAIKIWNDSFPDHANKECYDEFLLPIVSGKKKFTGDSDGDGYAIEDDDQKLHRNFPMLDSWDDVIRLKRFKLFLAELNLNHMRQNRRMFESDYLPGTSDYTETTYVNEFNDLFMELKDLAKVLSINPIEVTDTSRIISVKDPGFKFGAFTDWFLKEKYYFQNKYGQEIIFEDVDDYSFVFALENARTKQLIKLEIYQSVATDYTNKNSKAKKTTVVSANKKTTPLKSDVNPILESGWLSPDGEFYGCGFEQHNVFSEELVEFLKLESPTPIDRKEHLAFENDAEIILEKLKWIKISSKRYLWNFSDFVLTKKQENAIRKFMKFWGQEKAIFGMSCGTSRPLEYAINENKEDYEFYKRTKK